MTTTLSADPILEIGQSFWKAKALMSAVELDLFTVLAADGPLGVDAICQRAGLHARARDFLDALVALGLLQRDEEHRYANTCETDCFLDRRKPAYSGGFLEMCNDRLYQAWTGLTTALRTGRSVHGVDPGDFNQRVYTDDTSRRVFLGLLAAIRHAGGRFESTATGQSMARLAAVPFAVVAFALLVERAGVLVAAMALEPATA